MIVILLVALSMLGVGCQSPSAKLGSDIRITSGVNEVPNVREGSFEQRESGQRRPASVEGNTEETKSKASASKQRVQAKTKPTSEKPRVAEIEDQRIQLKGQQDYQFPEAFTIQFKEGKASLSAHSKEKLTEFLLQAKTSGRMKKVMVATWADHSFSWPEGEVPKEQQELVEARNEVIHRFLDEELDLHKTELYGMAESANWLERLFQTKEAQLKKSFVSAEGRRAKILKALGEASHSVIIIEDPAT